MLKIATLVLSILCFVIAMVLYSMDRESWKWFAFLAFFNNLTAQGFP